MDFSVASPRRCSNNVVEILQVVEHGPYQYVGKRINASKSHQRSCSTSPKLILCKKLLVLRSKGKVVEKNASFG